MLTRNMEGTRVLSISWMNAGPSLYQQRKNKHVFIYIANKIYFLQRRLHHYQQHKDNGKFDKSLHPSNSWTCKRHKENWCARITQSITQEYWVFFNLPSLWDPIFIYVGAYSVNITASIPSERLFVFIDLSIGCNKWWLSRKNKINDKNLRPFYGCVTYRMMWKRGWWLKWWCGRW